ncbi:MAG: M15 family metallopeptidase [Robiginitomaculum sp.]|nr:M15 family metallopeptidase [Robiginitomaculum sp.]
MSFVLSSRSVERLSGVHPMLQRVVHSAILDTKVDFAVLEGRRSLVRQQELFRAGASQTLRSRHLSGHAVDLGAWVSGGIRWDWPLYHKIAAAMCMAAKEHQVDLHWGGHWNSFPDGPHFELSWQGYPL